MRIMIAHDGSADAEATVQLVGLWPFFRDEPVLVTAVAPDRSVLGRGLQSPHVSSHASLVETARRITTDAVEQLQAAGISSEPLVVEGDPADRIVAIAEERSIDLIVLGAKGVARIRRFLLGSVSERVARHAPCSVLVTRRPAAPLRSILVAYDGSPAADQAVNALIRSLELRDVQAQALSVLPAVQPGAAGADARAYELRRAHLAETRRQEEAQARHVLEVVVKRLADRESKATSATRVGNTIEEIVEAAEAREDDLIVVGSRSLSRLDRMLLGSVATGVIRQASCSVLVGRDR